MQPSITNCFLSERDAISTLGSLKDLAPDLDQHIRYHRFNEARNTYIHRSKLVILHDKLMPLIRDPDICVVQMIE